MRVHPKFDPETWFVPDLEFEAPTLAALQRLLGPQVRLTGYYPRGLGAALAAKFIKRAYVLLPADTPPPALQPRVVSPRVGRPPKPPTEPPPNQPVEPAPRKKWNRAPGATRVDLDKFISACSGGAKCPELQERFSISRSYVRTLQARARAAGRLPCRNQGYDRQQE